MQCDGCYYQDRYENVCNHGSPIFDIEDNCTDYIEDDFVKEIRADERSKVIKKFLLECKKRRFKSSKYTSINVVDYADIVEIAEQLKEQRNETM